MYFMSCYHIHMLIMAGLLDYLKNKLLISSGLVVSRKYDLI